MTQIKKLKNISLFRQWKIVFLQITQGFFLRKEKIEHDKDNQMLYLLIFLFSRLIHFSYCCTTLNKSEKCNILNKACLNEMKI